MNWSSLGHGSSSASLDADPAATRPRSARWAVGILAAALVAIGLVATLPGGTPSPAAASEGSGEPTTLTVGVVDPTVDSLNPFTSIYSTPTQIHRLMYDYLTMYSAEDATPTRGCTRPHRRSGQGTARRTAGPTACAGSGVNGTGVLAHDQAMEPLVGVLSEHDRAVRQDDVGMAAVLVDPGPGVPRRGQHGLRGAAGRPPDQRHPPGLRGARLAPPVGSLVRPQPLRLPVVTGGGVRVDG